MSAFVPDRTTEDQLIEAVLNGRNAERGSKAWTVARDSAVELHAALEPLVVESARRHVHLAQDSVDAEDRLIGAGRIGLELAMDHFHDLHTHRFSTYALWWIHMAIHRELSLVPNEAHD